MKSNGAYKRIEDFILNEYNTLNQGFSEEEIIVCKHLGTFSQDILISFVSIIEHFLIQNTEVKRIQNRLTYLIIETIQNIIFHSEKLPDNIQLAYIIVTQNSDGYTIYSANLLETKFVPQLKLKLDELLKTKSDLLSKLFTKKIQHPKINESGHAGIGLLTMVSKSGKDFNYKITKFSPDNSLFHIQLNLKYKNFN